MAWLDSGWKYRKSLKLSRSSGAVTNYQMKLLIGESSGASGEDIDCHGKCLSTFADLRFTTSNGITLLDYWIESISGTTPNQLATVWVEFDSIGTSDTTFYMYYGNSGASSVSNGSSTFLFFDDFTGSSLDTTNNWTVVSGSQTVSSSAVTVSTPGHIESKSTFSTNRRYRSRINYASNGSMKFGFSTQTDYATVFHGSTPDSNVLNALNRNPYPTQTGVNLGDICEGSYNIFEIKRNSTTNAIYDINNSTVATISSNVPTGSLPITYDAHLQTLISDWVFVSQYLSTEPAWGTWGAEETRTKIYLPFRGTSRFLNYTI